MPTAILASFVPVLLALGTRLQPFLRRNGPKTRHAAGGRPQRRRHRRSHARGDSSVIVGYSWLRTCGQQECDLQRSGGVPNAHDTLWTHSPSQHALLPLRLGSNCPLAPPQLAYRVAEHTLLHTRTCHESNASTVPHARSRRLSLPFRWHLRQSPSH